MDVPLVRRFVAMLAFAVWLGGFTFYAAVVVPTGTDWLGGAVAQGFITQAVTIRLNILGVGTLAALLWNALATRVRGRLRASLVLTLALLATTLALLFALHPALDRLLDRGARAVLDEPRFYALHRAYLLTSTVQWVAGLAHLGLVISAWRREDRGQV